MKPISFLFHFWHVLLWSSLPAALRDSWEDALTPDYSEFYYYRNLEEKMAEVMSINNCSTSGDTITGFEAQTDAPDFSIDLIKPPLLVRRKWGTEGNELHAISKIYIKTTSNLCYAKPYISYKRGTFKNSKGCLDMFRTDKATGVRTKVIKRYGATLHPEHIRCKTKLSGGICVAASKNAEQVPLEFRSLNAYPFLITARNVIVARSGFLSLPCGPVGLFSSCEAVGRGVPPAAEAVLSAQICRDSDEAASSALRQDNYVEPIDGRIDSNSSTSCPYRRYKRVFVMAQYDDTQIGQFMQESLPRLVYHLDFLLANPDIKIQFGFTKLPTVPVSVLPHAYFTFLGISLDRIINDTIYAKEAYMPREGGCQDAGYNAWEVVTMRERFLQMANIEDGSRDTRKKKYILILSRSGGDFTNNKSDYRRWWPQKELKRLVEELERTFPGHETKIFSDQDVALMSCIQCHVDLFYHADIVIGHHGAGLMNTMWMRTGGIVVEVLPYFDSRHAPLTGIFPRVSGVIGLHHYSYFIGDNPFEKEVSVFGQGRIGHVVVSFDAYALVRDVLLFAGSVGLDLTLTPPRDLTSNSTAGR